MEKSFFHGQFFCEKDLKIFGEYGIIQISDSDFCISRNVFRDQLRNIGVRVLCNEAP